MLKKTVQKRLNYVCVVGRKIKYKEKDVWKQSLDSGRISEAIDMKHCSKCQSAKIFVVADDEYLVVTKHQKQARQGHYKDSISSCIWGDACGGIR